MRPVAYSSAMLALSLAGIGILSLVYRDYAMNWQPVPAWVPWRPILASLSGAILLAGSLGMLIRRTAAVSASGMALFLLSWLILLQLPPVIAKPLEEGRWIGVGENLLLVTGAWAVYLGVGGLNGRAFGRVGVLAARWAFALALLPIALGHVFYLKPTGDLIPAWIPGHVFFAWFVCVADIAAALAIAFGVLARLAATLQAAMMAAFAVLCWAPGVVRPPSDRFHWTAMLISFALAGAAWALSQTYADAPWFSLAARPRNGATVSGQLT